MPMSLRFVNSGKKTVVAAVAKLPIVPSRYLHRSLTGIRESSRDIWTFLANWLAANRASD
jgi:hypothetical protein